MASHDYIDQKNAIFNPWQSNFIIVFDSYKATYDLPSGAAAEEIALKVKQTRYETAWGIVNTGQYTDADLVELNDARHEYESGAPENPLDTSLRIFIGRYLRKNKLVTKKQREELGITIADTIKSPVTDTNAKLSGIELNGNIKVYKHLIHQSEVKTPGKGSRAKGEGVLEIEVWICIVDDPKNLTPPDEKLYVYAGKVNAGIYTHTFIEDQVACRAWYRVRKIIKGKQKTFGPFSAPWSGVIA